MDRSKSVGVDRSKPVGADFLQLDPSQAPPGGLAVWLAERVRAAMADGRLSVGDRLPATRVLAAELRVSRGVVTEAYRRLAEEGRVSGRGGGGTVVVAAPVRVQPEEPRRPATRSPFAGVPDAEVFDLLREAPARIDLSPGLPDLAAFPRAAWLRAERAVLADLAGPQLGYGDPQGTMRLRAAVSAWLARNRGIRVAPEEVVVVAGTAQALALMGRVLGAEGVTSVAVEDPGSLGVRQHLTHAGLGTPPVGVDAEGVRVDELAACGASAVLLTPAHQFPTGVVLSGARRRTLMEWARGGGLVIEDDYDAEHRYDRAPVPALRSLLPEGVCYAGSVSKLLAPALRLGWLLVPERYRKAVVDAKRLADLGGPALPQLVLAELMESGAMERHLRVLRGRHRRRRDAMIAAVNEYLPGAVVHGAAAGLHLTVTFPGRWSDTEVAARALERGVKVQPLSWHRQRPGPPGLVLGYAAPASSVAAEGVRVLGTVLGAR